MLINVSNLIFEYTGFRALNDLSFSIPAGSITALVGPNGAGKTTLLRCLSALDQPLTGSIQINNIDVLEHPRLCHRQVGYLSDFFGLYDRLTVRQCLYFVARAQGIETNACEQAILRVSQQLNISDRLDMTPTELSRGLRQRVAIAQAIIHQPKVILLDEPASGLDPEARHLLAELFLALQKQGMTLIVSSHILAELEAYSSDMLVLREGKIIEHISIQQKAEQLKAFKLVLTHPSTELATILSTIDQLTELKIEAEQATFKLGGDLKSQHELLKKLLEHQLPVCEFSPITTNLQDAYLSTVKL
ncbi:MAG: ABC transporter ATP-binding protein [Methylococcales bacterium]|nr:ABC transporter ATP-binding protein [Methylococcales bacterium]